MPLRRLKGSHELGHADGVKLCLAIFLKLRLTSASLLQSDNGLFEHINGRGVFYLTDVVIIRCYHGHIIIKVTVCISCNI